MRRHVIALLLSIAVVSLLGPSAADVVHAAANPCDSRAASLTPARSHACALYTRGIAALQAHDGARAEAMFTAALAADPSFTLAYVARAATRYGLAQYRAAQADLLVVLARVPALREQYPLTTAALRKAAALPPGTANDDYIGGLSGIILGDERGALTLFDAAIAANPRLADAYHFRGNIYADEGDTAHAEADYQHALALDPRSAATLEALGSLAGDSGNYSVERAYMTRAIAIDPTIVGAWVDRGIARQNLGDLSGAIADETRALQLDPMNTDAWIDRSQFESDAHHYTAAIADATQALRLGPIPAAYIARAVARRAIGDAQGAYADASAAIRLLPGSEVAYVDRGDASGDMGHWSGALADARKAISLDPSNPLAYNLAGWALINLNQPLEAERYLNHALTLDHNFVDALVNRCQARALLHNYAASQDDCTRAILLDPSMASAYLDRGVDRIYLANPRGARADLEHALQMYQARHDARSVALAEMWLSRI